MSESVIVAVRVRPLNSKEKKEKCTEIQTINGNSITVTDPSSFTIFCKYFFFILWIC